MRSCVLYELHQTVTIHNVPEEFCERQHSSLGYEILSGCSLSVFVSFPLTHRKDSAILALVQFVPLHQKNC